MSKFGLYSGNSAASIPFESHLEGLEEQTKTLLLDLRNFVKVLVIMLLKRLDFIGFAACL